MLGLETSVAVTLQSLGAGSDGGTEGNGNGHAPPTTGPDAVAAMSVGDILALLSWRPARIAGLAVEQGGDQGGPVAVGMPGNLCVIDPTERWEVDPDRLASRSRNTPWAGRTLIGRVRHTVYRGEPVVVDTEAQR
jgi:dihydroorotase-like cyclic amidohydrolase